MWSYRASPPLSPSHKSNQPASLPLSDRTLPSLARAGSRGNLIFSNDGADLLAVQKDGANLVTGRGRSRISSSSTCCTTCLMPTMALPGRRYRKRKSRSRPSPDASGTIPARRRFTTPDSAIRCWPISAPNGYKIIYANAGLDGVAKEIAKLKALGLI